MGYMRHHAIVVTSWNEETIQLAHQEAHALFDAENHKVAEVTPLTEMAINGYQSFLVAPDGSKEGWSESDRGDAAREAFVQWLGSHFIDWVEIQFGDDDGVTRVVNHSDIEDED